jgi:FixJ family two-component response regulator
MRSGKSYIVGVVDDDKRVLRSLKGLLEAIGHCPFLFSSAEAFLESNGIHAVDCLISDIGMPGMDGIALRVHVRTERPELPVFLLTGREELLTKAATDEHRDRLLLKPLNGPQLVAALDGAFASPHYRKLQ